MTKNPAFEQLKNIIENCVYLEIIPQKDDLKDHKTGETHFIDCSPEEAEIWAVFGKDQAGEVILIKDFYSHYMAAGFVRLLYEHFSFLQKSPAKARVEQETSWEAKLTEQEWKTIIELAKENCQETTCENNRLVSYLAAQDMIISEFEKKYFNPKK